MIEKRSNRSFSSRKIEKLLQLMNDQHRVLVTAGCDKKVLADHAALIRFLKGASTQDVRRIFSGTALVYRLFSAPERTFRHTEVELPDMPLAELEEIISDEATPRKYLEEIAIHRFKVPRGSMRSFSNREMLVDKLRTLIRNEQSHVAIEAVAKRQT